MPENTNISPFLSSFMTAIFIFSTIWTLAFFYYQGVGQSLQTTGLEDTTNDPTSITKTNAGIFGFVVTALDGVFELLSWINPFGLVKLIIQEVMTETPIIYLILNYLILRPVGWIFTVIEVNYILSKIPTMSGE